MWRKAVPSIVLLCTFSVTGLPAQAQQAPAAALRIGVSGPFSGGSGPMGQSMLNGIRLAVDEINHIGGINGRKIALIERDDQAKNAVGAKIAQEFVRQKVVAAIGIVNTGVGLASIDAYQAAKIPLLIAVSTGTSLTRKYAPPQTAENYIFRIAPTLDLEAKVLVADLKRRGLANVAVLADTTAYGEAGLKSFEQHSKLAGIALLSEERFNIGDSDMSAQVQRAKATAAQAVVVWGIGPEMAIIAKNREQQGWKVPLLGSSTFSMRNFIDGAGKAGEGALMPQTFIQDIGSTSKNSFLLAYRRTFKTDTISSPMSAAQGYDGMHLLYLAMRQADSTEGVKIKEAFENLKSRYQGVITNYHKPFSRADHDAITQNMLLLGKVTAGRVDYAYADDQRRGALMRLKNK